MMSTFSNENKLLHTSDYQDHFDTESYLEEIYSGVDSHPNITSYLTFVIENTIRILNNEQKRLENRKALEFGGGPTLWPSFVLAQYVDSIRFCDYTQRNRDAVKNWIDQKSNAFNWTTVFERVLDANEIPKEKLAEWESRLRDALTRGGLSTCDVNDLNCPILSGQADEYDIIFSSLCLEAACLTIELFNETIKRLVRLLKPGGLLLLLMVRNESFYYVNKNKFVCLPLDETKVEQALNQTNELVDIHINSVDMTIDDLQDNTICDYDGIMVIHGYKRIIL